MSRIPPKERSEQMYDGVWYRAESPYYHECCGCALTHYVEHKLDDGKLMMRWTTIKPRQTRRSRKRNA